MWIDTGASAFFYMSWWIRCGAVCMPPNETQTTNKNKATNFSVASHLVRTMLPLHTPIIIKYKTTFIHSFIRCARVCVWVDSIRWEFCLPAHVACNCLSLSLNLEFQCIITTINRKCVGISLCVSPFRSVAVASSAHLYILYECIV